MLRLQRQFNGPSTSAFPTVSGSSIDMVGSATAAACRGHHRQARPLSTALGKTILLTLGETDSTGVPGACGAAHPPPSPTVTALTRSRAARGNYAPRPRRTRSARCVARRHPRAEQRSAVAAISISGPPGPDDRRRVGPHGPRGSRAAGKLDLASEARPLNETPATPVSRRHETSVPACGQQWRRHNRPGASARRRHKSASWSLPARTGARHRQPEVGQIGQPRRRARCAAGSEHQHGLQQRCAIIGVPGRSGVARGAISTSRPATITATRCARLPHQGQVVRDEQVGQARRCCSRPQQCDDLGLGAYVQRRHWLVTDDEVGVHRQRASR